MTKSLRTFVSFALVASAGSAVRAERQIVDRVAAVIEDEIITLRELENKAQPFMEQLDEIDDPQKKREKRRQILEQVLDIEIGERIVNKELEKNRDKLGVTDADVDRAIEEVLRMNNMTRDQLQAALYGQGMTWSEYRRKLQEQIERAKLIQFKVQGKVQISDKEAKRRCKERQESGAGERVCASHILLKVPEESQSEAVRAQAAKIQAELANGADFAAYALKHSADKGAPDGDLGCFGRGEMVDAFEDTAFETPIGKVSKVVRTEFGFHILKVHDRKTATTGCETQENLAPFRNEIYQQQVEQQMNIWIDELRKNAFVEVRL